MDQYKYYDQFILETNSILCFIRFSSQRRLFRSSDPFSQCILPCYVLSFWYHLHHTRIGWIRGILSCPIQHLLEPSTSSCKTALSLFRYQLHINATRELVERQLMQRQQLLKIFVYLLFLTLGSMSHLQWQCNFEVCL